MKLKRTVAFCLFSIFLCFAFLAAQAQDVQPSAVTIAEFFTCAVAQVPEGNCGITLFSIYDADALAGAADAVCALAGLGKASVPLTEYGQSAPAFEIAIGYIGDMPHELALLLTEEDRALASQGAAILLKSMEQRHILLITGTDGASMRNACRMLSRPDCLSQMTRPATAVNPSTDYTGRVGDGSIAALLPETVADSAPLLQNWPLWFLSQGAPNAVTLVLPTSPSSAELNAMAQILSLLGQVRTRNDGDLAIATTDAIGDLTDRNVILIGTPLRNPVLYSLNTALAFPFSADGTVLGSAAGLPVDPALGARAGMAQIMLSPFSEHHALLAVSGVDDDSLLQAAGWVGDPNAIIHLDSNAMFCADGQRWLVPVQESYAPLGLSPKRATDAWMPLENWVLLLAISLALIAIGCWVILFFRCGRDKPRFLRHLTLTGVSLAWFLIAAFLVLDTQNAAVNLAVLAALLLAFMICCHWRGRVALAVCLAGMLGYCAYALIAPGTATALMPRDVVWLCAFPTVCSLAGPFYRGVSKH